MRYRRFEKAQPNVRRRRSWLRLPLWLLYLFALTAVLIWVGKRFWIDAYWNLLNAQ